MNGITLPDNFSSLCNCRYSISGGEQVGVSLEALFKLMEDIPKVPRILTMPIQMKELKVLTDNTIFISSDIAKALEEAIEEGKQKDEKATG